MVRKYPWQLPSCPWTWHNLPAPSTRSVRTYPSLLATDGATYLADEARAYWLFDLVWGVLPKITDEFAILELSLREGTDGAGLKIHDGREPETVYHRQEITRTDFPLPSVTLYIQQNSRDWVVLLKSEY